MLCSNGTNIISFLALNHDIFFLPLKHKIHIFLSPYNILYIYMFRNRGLLSVFIASSKHEGRGREGKGGEGRGGEDSEKFCKPKMRCN